MLKRAHPSSAVPHTAMASLHTPLHPGEKLSPKLNSGTAETGDELTNQSSGQINQKHVRGVLFDSNSSSKITEHVKLLQSYGTFTRQRCTRKGTALPLRFCKVSRTDDNVVRMIPGHATENAVLCTPGQ